MLYRANIYLPNPGKTANLEQPRENWAETSDALWWLMHHSDDPERRSAVITCYLDDSDSERLGFIGGTVMHREQYDRLSAAWGALLYEYRLESIHMQDFIRPQGRYIGMRRELNSRCLRTLLD